MHRLYAAAMAVTMLCCAITSARAATTGVVRGTLTSSGRPLTGVVLTLAGDGSSLQTTSQRDGRFVFNEVPFGHYHLSARNGAISRSVDVDVASDALVTVDLALDAVREIANVGVTARSGVGGSPVSVNALARDQIAASPNRDSLNRLIATMPGIVQFSYGEPVAHGFHGLTYEIDGAPLPQATSAEFSEIIDPKSIDSLEVMTGAFPAEYGGSRQGAVVNVVSTRLSDLTPGNHGAFSVGSGELGTSLASLTDRFRGKRFELALVANAQRSSRGIDAPTYRAIHDEASQGDQLLRGIFAFDPHTTLSVDLSNQFAQFQIPINTDSANPNDPIVSVPGTDDVQREYDRYASVNLTRVSRDGNTVATLVPWLRSTRIVYAGDLRNDVLATAPNPASQAGAPARAQQTGLAQDRRAAYVGVRASLLRSSERHAFKAGVDLSRETFSATQTFACYSSDCTTAPATPQPPPPAPGYYAFLSTQAQTGSQTGLYIEDKWRPSATVALNLGLRYDRSSGYTAGSQISPRIGINISDGERTILHAYYGRMYAAPQLEDVRAACVLLSGCSATPVYDLQPERDAYAELGIEHTFSQHAHGYITIFRRTASNVLDTTQFLNTPLFAVFNNAIGIDSGIEGRYESTLHDGNSFTLSATVSGAYAGGVSGTTFLFPPNPPNVSLTDPAQLAPEDHDQTVNATASYTARFGAQRFYYATLQTNYGTGYPVNFQNASGYALNGRLPAHTTFDLSLGRRAEIGERGGIGFSLDATNLLSHQYPIKVANGFNTTQIAAPRRIVLRLVMPY